MLITSRKKKKWIIPKGIVEPYMTPQLSAAQEAFEEAGLFGRVWEEPVGSYQTEKWEGVCTVTVYPMSVEKVYDEWMEDDFRKRKWFSPEKALEACEDKDIRIMIKNFLAAYGKMKSGNKD